MNQRTQLASLIDDLQSNQDATYADLEGLIDADTEMDITSYKENYAMSAIDNTARDTGLTYDEVWQYVLKNHRMVL